MLREPRTDYPPPDPLAGQACARCGAFFGDREGVRFCPRCGLAQLYVPPVALTEPGRRLLMPPLAVAGFQYYDGPAIWREIAVGDRLELRSEPECFFDPYAIAIYRFARKIGYVPIHARYRVFHLLQHRVDLNARVIGKDPRWRFGYHSLRFQIDVPADTA